MLRRLLSISIICAAPLLIQGCSSGDVPVEQVKAAPSSTSGGTMPPGVANNPNIPQAAKDAMAGKAK